jgi:hypothetical protein
MISAGQPRWQLNQKTAPTIAERNRLEAAVQQRQPNARVVPAEIAIRERLFTEARSYAEKSNVADCVEDRLISCAPAKSECDEMQGRLISVELRGPHSRSWRSRARYKVTGP